MTTPNPTQPPLQPNAVTTADGATAAIEDDTIVVRDEHGRVIVRYASGGGVTICAAQGDLRLAAPNGRVIIESGSDVAISAPRRLSLVADRIVETARSAYREIDDLSQSRAGRVRTLVKGAYQLFAKRTSLLSEDDTSIDGKRVLLG